MSPSRDSRDGHYFKSPRKSQLESFPAPRKRRRKKEIITVKLTSTTSSVAILARSGRYMSNLRSKSGIIGTIEGVC